MVIYRQWQEYLPHIPKSIRYTVGHKIDALFVEIIENLFIASFLPAHEKLPYLKKAATKLDLAQFFLQICWEVKGLEIKRYVHLATQLIEIGKMLGGWIKQIAGL